MPLYFPSPEKPTLWEVPSWLDWKEGRVSSIPIKLFDIHDIPEQFSTMQIAVVEVYWAYRSEWHPRIAVITIHHADGNPSYKSHEVGRLYWDAEDTGRVIHGRQIPNCTPVEEAIRLGKLLAESLNTTYYFESPDKPHWQPRWIDCQINNENKEE